jgi:hypothetical protein
MTVIETLYCSFLNISSQFYQKDETGRRQNYASDQERWADHGIARDKLLEALG